MALRKPLVVINGVIQQISSSDTLDASLSEVDVVNLNNNSGAAINICTPVAISGSGQIVPARANAASTIEVIGLVKDTQVANGAAGAVQTDGVLAATTAQWDAATGQTGGLTAGSVYYLSASAAGQLTTTAPTSQGQYVARVGRALSATALDLAIHQPILL